MLNISHPQKFYLKTITPLHIGNNQQYEIFDFVKQNNKIYLINIYELLEFASEQNSEILNEFNDFIEEILKIAEKKSENQESNQFLKEKLKLYNFFKNGKDKILKEYLNYIEKNKKSNVLLGQFDENKKFHIKSQLKHPSGSPYIPGSSIKGAIRTALLFDIIKQSDNTKTTILNKALGKAYNDAEKSLINNKNNKHLDKIKKIFAEELEKNYFYSTYEEPQKNIYATSPNQIKEEFDEKYDLLKFLRISDANLSDHSKKNQEYYYVIKKSLLILKDKEPQHQTPYIEAINENLIFEFTIDFDIFYLFELSKLYDYNHNAIIEKDKNEKIISKKWINLREKIQSIYGIDIKNLNQNNLNDFKKNIIQNIINKIIIFFNEIKKFNIEFSKKIKDKKSYLFDEKQSKTFDSQKSDSSFYLNLAFASGFYTTTIYLYFYKLYKIDPNNKLAMLFNDTMQLLEIGKKNKNSFNFSTFPVSRTVFEHNNQYFHFGITEISSSLQHLTSPTSTTPEDLSVYFIDASKIKKGSKVNAKILKHENGQLFFELLLNNYNYDKNFRINYGTKIEPQSIIEVLIRDLDKRNNQIKSVFFEKIIYNHKSSS